MPTTIQNQVIANNAHIEQYPYSSGFWAFFSHSLSLSVNHADTPHDSQEKLNIDTFYQPINILIDSLFKI